MSASIPFEEIAKHNSKQSCWVVIHGKVYDLTHFLNEHPGGSAIILNEAGGDATAAFSSIHPKSLLSILPSEALKGIPTGTPIKSNKIKGDDNDKNKDEGHTLSAKNKKEKSLSASVPLDSLLNTFDFESLAKTVIPKEGWDYYSSGGDDEITLRENHLAFQRISLVPRVLVNVSNINTSTVMFGRKVTFPLYFTATALAKLAHPKGETAIVRAAGKCGVIYMLPTLSSCDFEEMVESRVSPDQPLWYQIYVNPNRSRSLEMIKRAEASGCEALCVTVDAPMLGRRERDMRNKFKARAPNEQMKGGDKVHRDEGVSRAISTFIDPSLQWKDITWLKSVTRMPIVLKGIQCGADAVMAVEYGCKGIILSNHGGRQLDTCRSGIEVLLEVHNELKSKGLLDKVEIYVDGGIRRGTDIFKALAMGARGVGIGRPVLWGLGAFGEEGIIRMAEILRKEFEMACALMGCASLEDINPKMVITRNLTNHSHVPTDYLAEQNYEPMRPISSL